MIEKIFDLIKLKENDAFRVSVIGSGGKTSLIRSLAYIAEIRKISTIITTTTHMIYPFAPFINPDKITGDRRLVLGNQLKKHKLLLAADDVTEALRCTQISEYNDDSRLLPNSSKLSSPGCASLSDFNFVAELILAEADGSKMLPMKVCKEGEPVLLENTDLCILVFGISAIGRPLEQVCHRYETAEALLNIKKDHIVDEELAARLIELSYLPRLENQNVALVINQADDENAEISAGRLIGRLGIANSYIVGNNPLRVYRNNEV